MRKAIFTIVIVSISLFRGYAQLSLSYYLPNSTTYNPSIPKPKSVIGYQPGEWHISHDKLVKYMEAIATSSDRVTLSTHGRTYENRPLISLIITSPSNHKRVEEIRENHIRLSDPRKSSDLDTDKMPVVVYLGYSVHGNEPSGSNASVLVAYHLAAAKGKEIEKLLDNVVVILDPSMNPDGLNRNASWVNSRKSLHPVSDPNDMEHNEPWPGGRTNHYWYDLNRDWLPAQLPESQARLTNYHKWKPNILTDHHEMQTNSTFFFQPGVPSRNNPLTPAKNYELTEKIAQYHAKALDGIGTLYYTREDFDDFYYGKGSSYPDTQGCIGILFEQARVEGHVQESDNGLLTFPFAIRNQLTTSLSTLKAAQDMRVTLLDYQQEFFLSASREASKDQNKGYIVTSKDIHRLNAFAQILLRHKITFSKLSGNTTISERKYDSACSYVISLDQPQYRLIKSIFEQRTTFQDSLFYDVSAWTLPLAFGLEFEKINSKNWSSVSKGKLNEQIAISPRKLEKSRYAYVLDWSQYYSPKALAMLHARNILTKVALEPFSYKGTNYKGGSILIPIQNQKYSEDELWGVLTEVQENTQVQISPLATGYTTGYNLGSPQFKSIKPQKVLLMVGDGVNAYDAGEVWHLLDDRMNIPMTSVNVTLVNRIDLSKYHTIVMVDGQYKSLQPSKLKNWVKSGGNIIAFKNAAKWLSHNGINGATFMKHKKDSITPYFPYNDRIKIKGAQRIGGAIFQAKLDLTHPLAFGYDNEHISTFRKGDIFMEKSKNPYANPLAYMSSPLQAGYISTPNLEKIKKSVVINVSHFGKGRILSYADNTNFRAFWHGTNRLFLNGLFFAQIIEKGDY